MSLRDHARSGAAIKISVNAPTPMLFYSPVVIPCPGRPVDRELKVSFPATGDNLPVILFSHEYGRSNNLSSLNGYGPLANLLSPRPGSWFSHANSSTRRGELHRRHGLTVSNLRTRRQT
ncbi:hypothetical protein GGR56DRAFT_621253 [Xylariaceae sp. FL0804]|nr:hypothetical protein GGR56DRAFT_621253 [Xylariaceae sp. FL0804]